MRAFSQGSKQKEDINATSNTFEDKPDNVKRTVPGNLVAAGLSRPEKKKKLTAKS
jgi:hypothetical protein